MKYCSECGTALEVRYIDGYDRYACSREECSYIHWNNPVPVVAALVLCNDKYIIARNVAWSEGIFSVITGFLEQEEEPEEAVIREVAEELGVDGKIVRHIGNYGFKKRNQVIMCYEVEACGQIALNHELLEYKALTPEELLDYDFTPLTLTERIRQDWAAKQR